MVIRESQLSKSLDTENNNFQINDTQSRPYVDRLIYRLTLVIDVLYKAKPFNKKL